MEGDLGIINRQTVDMVPEEDQEAEAVTDIPGTVTEIGDVDVARAAVRDLEYPGSEDEDMNVEHTELAIDESPVLHKTGFESLNAAGGDELGAISRAYENTGSTEQNMQERNPHTLSSRLNILDANTEDNEELRKWNSTSVSEHFPRSAGKLQDEAVTESSSRLFKMLSLKIQTQNNVMRNLKDKIKQKTNKFPKSLCEQHEIRNLNTCVQEESKKLDYLLRQVVKLQERDPYRKWPAIELATTYIEDCKPVAVKVCEQRAFCEENLLTTHPSSLETIEGSSEVTATTPDRYVGMFKNLEPENRESHRLIPRSEDPLFQQLRPENRRGYSLDPKDRLKSHYVHITHSNPLGSGLRKISPNRIIECIQQKVENIQKELFILERASPHSDLPRTTPMCKSQHSLAGRCVKKFGNVISRIQDILECGNTEKRNEYENTENCKKIEDICTQNRQHVCGCNSEIYDLSNQPYQDLKSRYCELLEDYRKKEREVLKLNSMVSCLKGNKVSKDRMSDCSSADLRVLREKLQRSEEDHEDLKILVNEQARQIDDYRAKYLASMQKIEEQKCFLQKMEMDNQRVEDHINSEIEQIKDRFQRKLNEYSQLPELLENEQIKLAECCRQKNDLEMKLRIVCRELRLMKSGQNEVRLKPDDPEKCKKLSNELSNLRQKYDLLIESNKSLSHQYEEKCREVGLLRSESAKIICRLRERAKMNQLTLETHIDDLEKELAKCRATASLSMADREAVIKDMQAQLNYLALSFDLSQKQIKTLKDHISSISSR